MQAGSNIIYLQSRLIKKVVQDENCTLDRIVRVLCTESLQYIANVDGPKDDPILKAVNCELKRRASS